MSNGKVGIAFLMKSDRVDKPITPSTWATLSAWTNPQVKAVVIRTNWDRVEPSMGQYYWDFIDAGLAQAEAHGKKAVLLVVAGVSTPPWFVAAKPNACFDVTLEDGSKDMMGLPWAPAFQGKWGVLIQALAARYDGRVAHVDMGGFGRKAESNFVSTAADESAIDGVARSQGFASGLDAWLSGAKWVTDAYARAFTRSAFIADLGAPWPTDAGRDKLAELVNYGVKYGNRFGAASHGLTEHAPSDQSIGFNLPPTIQCGFQFGLPQKDDISGFQQALNRATNVGAGWIEVYPSDCDDPRKTEALAAANAAMVQ